MNLDRRLQRLAHHIDEELAVATRRSATDATGRDIVQLDRVRHRPRLAAVAATIVVTIGAGALAITALDRPTDNAVGTAPPASSQPASDSSTPSIFPTIDLQPATIGTANTMMATRSIGDGYYVGEHAEITINDNAVNVAYTKDGGGIIGQEQRIINNILYSRFADNDDQLVWVETTTGPFLDPCTNRSLSPTDALNVPPASAPRELLAELAPSAGFASAGPETLPGDTANPAGIETEHLTATTPTDVTSTTLPALLHPSELDIWIDSTGTVRRITWTRTIPPTGEQTTDCATPPTTLQSDNTSMTTEFTGQVIPDAPLTVATIIEFSEIGADHLTITTPVETVEITGTLG